MSFETWRQRRRIRAIADDLEEMQSLRAYAERECARLQRLLIEAAEKYEGAIHAQEGARDPAA